jgi:hypothetical protein
MEHRLMSIRRLAVQPTCILRRRRLTVLALFAMATLCMSACSGTINGSGKTALPTAQSTAATSPDFSPSTAPPAASPTGPTTAQLLGRFAGRWSGHGRALTVTVGTGKITYRIYKWCSDDPTPPCDEMQNNEIIDGGLITFVLRSAYAAGTATVAEGEVTSSTDPTLLSGQPLTARVQGYVLSLSVFASAPFCSVDTPADQWTCGA